MSNIFTTNRSRSSKHLPPPHVINTYFTYTNHFLKQSQFNRHPTILTPIHNRATHTSSLYQAGALVMDESCGRSIDPTTTARPVTTSRQPRVNINKCLKSLNSHPLLVNPHLPSKPMTAEQREGRSKLASFVPCSTPYAYQRVSHLNNLSKLSACEVHITDRSDFPTSPHLILSIGLQ